MTRFGFVIDQRSCIGCYACTVACKEEHGVELGVFRTWVKYIEQGTFPDTRRYFSVLLCNHCDDAPCVEICPGHRAVPPRGWDRRLRPRAVHRLQGVPERLPVRRAVQRPGVEHCDSRPQEATATATSSSTCSGAARSTAKWLALARPAAAELRRPLWLFRQLKPGREAYRLPDDEQTERARQAAAGARWPSALELATLLDWSPEQAWGDAGSRSIADTAG